MSWFRVWYSKLGTLRHAHRSTTVRTMFSLMSAALLLGAAVVNSNDVSYIRLVGTQKIIEAGKPFSIDVFAYAHVPVNAVDITLRFDPNAVTVSSVDKGQSVLTIWTEEPIIEKEKVILRGGTFRRGFVGEHKIATLELIAKQTGQSDVSVAEVTLLAGDGKGTPVTVADATDSHVSLFVYDENSKPDNIGVSIAADVLTDIDKDGNVSLKDISSFMGAWTNKNYVYDFNGDGQMSFRDFSIILADAFIGE
jgi:hypothetical protein